MLRLGLFNWRKDNIIFSKSLTIVFGLTLVSAFFHFYNLGYEFSNDETHVVNATAQFIHGSIYPQLFGSIFIFGHPPVRLLINIPFVFLFGITETVMRFPHALFGVLSTVNVYLIGRKTFGEKEGILAASLYAISGISSINRQCQGVGLYSFFILLTLYSLLLFYEDSERQRENKHLMWAVICLVIATYTYVEAITFFIPMLFIVWRKRGNAFYKDPKIRLAVMLYTLALFFYIGLWSIMPTIAYQKGYINKDVAGNFAHIMERTAGIKVYNNLWDIFLQYVSYNSIIFMALLLIGMLLPKNWTTS